MTHNGRRPLGAGLRPRKMKRLELTVLTRDADGVIEFLGRLALMHLKEDESAEARAMDEAAYKHIRENLDKLRTASACLGVSLPQEPEEG
ncbi:MAG: hypothetical protein LBQ67_06795, partial [Treponema sp.]|nr:hypothetical protein [Treponema sp.]